MKDYPTKEEVVRKALTAVAVLSLLFVIGCPMGGDTAALDEKIENQTEKITELEGTIEGLTAEKDSLMKVIEEMGAKSGGSSGGSKPPRTGGSGGGQTGGGGKPPRTGR